MTMYGTSLSAVSFIKSLCSIRRISQGVGGVVEKRPGEDEGRGKLLRGEPLVKMEGGFVRPPYLIHCMYRCLIQKKLYRHHLILALKLVMLT